MNKIKPILIFLVVFLLTSSACSRAGFDKPIVKFQGASLVVIESSKTIFSELNKVERDQYILEKLRKREEIQLIELEKTQVFSREALKVRMDALEALKRYGELLMEAAKSDSPTKIKAEAINLGEAIKNLSSETSSLTGVDDGKFQSAVGPFATIIGSVLNLFIEGKIQDALNKAINEGEKPINALIQVLRSDMQLAYQRRKTALGGMRVLFVQEYKKELDKGNMADAERLKLCADRVIEHEDRWEKLLLIQPESGLDAMAKAHSALVTYANSKRKASDFATLVESMEIFASQALSIGQAINELKNL
ncbi:MAG: hypothetical protein WAQ98_13895 [Blastocatellia bacterium]